MDITEGKTSLDYRDGAWGGERKRDAACSVYIGRCEACKKQCKTWGNEYLVSLESGWYRHLPWNSGTDQTKYSNYRQVAGSFGQIERDKKGLFTK